MILEGTAGARPHAGLTRACASCKATEAPEHWAVTVQCACCEFHFGSCRKQSRKRAGWLKGHHRRLEMTVTQYHRWEAMKDSQKANQYLLK